MPSAALTSEVCAERFSAVLRRWAGEVRFARTRLARKTDSDPRAIENYLYGKHCPPAAKLIELMSECDELADEVMKMVAERKAARGE